MQQNPVGLMTESVQCCHSLDLCDYDSYVNLLWLSVVLYLTMGNQGFRALLRHNADEVGYRPSVIKARTSE